MKEALKKSGVWLLSVAAMVLIMLILGAILFGTAWLGGKIFPALNTIVAYAFLGLLVFTTPLVFFKSTRHIPGTGWVYWSYLLGVSTWILSLLTTLELWGLGAAVIGVLMMGIGVFPVAILACIFKGEWQLLGHLVLCLAILFTARFGGAFMMAKSKKYSD